MTIGSELQQAREQRGLTLIQISERTKIRVPVLRAIERDDFKQLPGGVIARGFVRLFAREVGLDADEIGARFTAEIELSGREHSPDGSGAHGADPQRVTPGTSRYRLRTAAAALSVVALLVAASYSLRLRSAAPSGANVAGQSDARGPAPVGTTSPSGPQATAAAATPPAAETVPAFPPPAAPSETVPAAKETSPLRLELQATDACWVSVTADGEQVAFRSLNPGERLAVGATTELVLRIGVPGNLVVSINEQRMPPSARPGTPITLRITPANYRDLFKP